MTTVQILDDKKYGKAVWILTYKVGGMFRTMPVRQLVIDPVQLRALQEAGLVPNTNGARKRGQKKA
jgi:hypothetical protein